MLRITVVTAAIGCSLLVACPAAGAASLLKNGSFEKPVVSAGGFLDFPSGSTGIPHWLTIGPADVAVVSGTFQQGCCRFPARKGKQWLDLTGRNSDTTDGVEQTVPTVAGGAYTLSFAVGNVIDPTGLFGSTSTVHVLLDGAPLATATNAAGGTTMSWQGFTVHLTAPTSSTTIAFVNGDGPTDNANGLDLVKLVAG